MMTWNQLSESISSMTPEQRRQPVRSVADRFALAAVSLDTGEEAPTAFETVTSARYVLSEIEEIGDGHRLAWYFHK
jgi:hypothetical protein